MTEERDVFLGLVLEEASRRGETLEEGRLASYGALVETTPLRELEAAWAWCVKVCVKLPTPVDVLDGVEGLRLHVEEPVAPAGLVRYVAPEESRMSKEAWLTMWRRLKEVLAATPMKAHKPLVGECACGDCRRAAKGGG